MSLFTQWNQNKSSTKNNNKQQNNASGNPFLNNNTRSNNNNNNNNNKKINASGNPFGNTIKKPASSNPFFGGGGGSSSGNGSNNMNNNQQPRQDSFNTNTNTKPQGNPFFNNNNNSNMNNTNNNNNNVQAQHINNPPPRSPQRPPPSMRMDNSNMNRNNNAMSMNGNSTAREDEEEAFIRASLAKKKQRHFHRRSISVRQRQIWEEEEGKHPLFKIVRTDSWRTDRVRADRGKIVVMTAANRTLIFATSNQYLIRWNMDSGEEPEEFNLMKKVGNHNIERLFLDPSGSHLIIVASNASSGAENFYMHSSYKKIRTLHKTKGVHICSVAWNKNEGTELSSKSILIGGRNGDIYEASLDENNRDKFFRKVYQLTESPGIVCGMEWEAFHTTNGVNDEEAAKYFVMIATAEPSRHYHFIGGPTFTDLFKQYEDMGHDKFNEVPGNLPYGELHFYADQLDMRADSFAILTQIGVVNGAFMFGSQSFGDTVVKDSNLLKYPKKNSNMYGFDDDGNMMNSDVLSGTGGSGGGNDGMSENRKRNFTTADPLNNAGPIPLSMAITKFHFLFLYEDRIVAVSRLSQKTKVMSDKTLDAEYIGPVKSLVRDPVGNRLWLYTATSLYQILFEREDRDVWQLYLEQAKNGDGREFEFAYQHAKTLKEKEVVRSAQADFYFNRKEYVMSAKYYATTSRSFEEIALKFASGNVEEKALKAFVIAKLRSLRPDQSTQRTILSLWLVEMFLSQMNGLDAMAEGSSLSSNIDSTKTDDDVTEDMQSIQDEFKSFLKDNRAHLGMSECAETTFQLISSHGRMDMLLYFADLIEDYERMMTLYVQEENYNGAVSLLYRESQRYVENHRRPPEKIESLFYKFSPILMEHAASTTVNAWKGMRRYLVASKLIPSLVRYSQRRQEIQQRQTRKDEIARRINQLSSSSSGKKNSEKDISGEDEDDDDLNNSNGNNGDDDEKNVDYAVEYLEFCVFENRNKEAAIHNFLVSLYAQRNDNGEKILQFLDGSGGNRPYFDLDYALRVCIQNGQHLACVRIYSMMNLPDQAVSLALKCGDIELAKQHADVPDEDEMKKKLWLRIAKQVITQQADIKKAIGIIQESNDLLKIEDILPLFPDFTVIEDFKDEICQALEEYNDSIKALKDEMDEYVESAEQIRGDIKLLQTRKGQVNSRARCELTGEYISGHDFYLLPDGRTYKANALLAWVLKNEKNCEKAGFNLNFNKIKQLNEEIEEIDEKMNMYALGNNNGTNNNSQGRSKGSSMMNESAKEIALARRRAAQKELDEYVANGVIIDMIHIANIDVPFETIGNNDGNGDDEWSL